MHAHERSRRAQDRRSLAIALALNVAFMAGEVAAAVLAGSLALLADAGHMLTDAAALGGALVASRLATRPARGRWTFGLGRVEILAAQANGVALLVVGPGRGFVLGLHKASFAVWLVATGLHVLAYVWRVPALAASDWRRRDPAPVGGSFARRTLVAGALVAGVILAVATVRYAQPWVHWAAVFHGHDH